MRTAFVIAITVVFLSPVFLSPAAAGKSDRGPGASAGERKSGLFLKRSTLAHRRQVQRDQNAALKEEPFCVRPFEYPRRTD